MCREGKRQVDNVQMSRSVLFGPGTVGFVPTACHFFGPGTVHKATPPLPHYRYNLASNVVGRLFIDGGMMSLSEKAQSWSIDRQETDGDRVTCATCPYPLEQQVTVQDPRYRVATRHLGKPIILVTSLFGTAIPIWKQWGK